MTIPNRTPLAVSVCVWALPAQNAKDSVIIVETTALADIWDLPVFALMVLREGEVA
jgi:hypothetical protein